MNMMKYLNLVVLYVIVFVFVFPTCFSTSDIKWYASCGQNFTCGPISVGFPFWGGDSRPQECGYPGLELTCEGEIKTTIQMSGMKFYVLGFGQNNTVRIARQDLTDGICLQKFVNTTLNFQQFYYTLESQNITILYGCPPMGGGYGDVISYKGQFTCKYSDTKYPISYFQPGVTGPSGCYQSVFVPVLGSLKAHIGDDNLSVSVAVDKGFEVGYIVQEEDLTLCYDCEESKGRCGFDVGNKNATCVCPDGSSGYAPCGLQSQISPKQGNKSLKKAVIIGVSAGGGIVLALLAVCVFMVRRRKRILSQTRTKDLPPGSLSMNIPTSNGFNSSQGYTTSPSTYRSQSTPSYPSSKSDLDNNSSYLGVKLFSYGELEEATENFNEARELGDGGFGTVYYGELHDGRVVAVKRLYENSVKRMGQFMNEVQILARLRHDNLVTLYGCTSKRSRDLLLVYEYIPNGTVADHLHGKLSVMKKLPWSIRLSIAVETAEALSFLHENDVIHRDVKTTNILLDNNFQVKVADFGLSRLFPNDVTHVSTAPQGTPGYVDPEYYQCYHLTEKSDVFSFGVVLMELISSKVAVDITRRRHDINLSNMAVDRIQKHALQELVDPNLGYDKDYVIQKIIKLTAELAFRCLQQERDMRPSMKDVLQSLKDIQKTMVNAQNQVVVDIIHESDDDVGLLKNAPPLSPETEVNDRR
ncbi:hypothetical protein vseg_006557 [Gypsophila vaccaria]